MYPLATRPPIPTQRRKNVSIFDDDAGYHLDDRKHPTYFDRQAEEADRRRKMEREDELERAERENDAAS